MKNIKEYLINEDTNEEIIDESLAVSTVLFASMMMISAQMLMLGSAATSGDPLGFVGAIDTIKNWWKDAKANKIIKKLAQDEEVKKFLKDNEGKQGKGWRDLLKSKLDEKEYEYITRITQNKTRAKIK